MFNESLVCITYVTIKSGHGPALQKAYESVLHNFRHCGGRLVELMQNMAEPDENLDHDAGVITDIRALTPTMFQCEVITRTRPRLGVFRRLSDVIEAEFGEGLQIDFMSRCDRAAAYLTSEPAFTVAYIEMKTARPGDFIQFTKLTKAQGFLRIDEFCNVAADVLGVPVYDDALDPPFAAPESDKEFFYTAYNLNLGRRVADWPIDIWPCTHVELEDVL